jgi:transposase
VSNAIDIVARQAPASATTLRATRRGHDGLVAFVRGELGADPYQGDLFVFVGRTRDRLKILGWDRGGFVLVYKRLSKGRFRLPSVPPDADRVTIDKTELAMILGSFDLASAKRQDKACARGFARADIARAARLWRPSAAAARTVVIVPTSSVDGCTAERVAVHPERSASHDLIHRYR